MDKKEKIGLTLIELLLTIGILAIVLSGMLLFFMNCILFNQLNRDLALAYSATQSKMEEIKDAGFDNLFSVCPTEPPSGSFCDGNTFDLEGISEGKARIEITQEGEAANLKQIRIVACFKSRNRIVGEDADFDGMLDSGEDTIVENGQIDSQVELITLIAQ